MISPIRNDQKSFNSRLCLKTCFPHKPTTFKHLSQVPHLEIQPKSSKTKSLKERPGILEGRYSMDDWEGVSQEAKEVIDLLLKVEPSRRLSAKELLEHPWLQRSAPHQQLEATALKHLKALETGTSWDIMDIMELRKS